MRPGSSIVRANLPGCVSMVRNPKMRWIGFGTNTRAVGLTLRALVATDAATAGSGPVVAFMGLRVRQTNQRDMPEQARRNAVDLRMSTDAESRREETPPRRPRAAIASATPGASPRCSFAGLLFAASDSGSGNIERDRQNVGVAAGIHGDDQVDVTALFQERRIEMIDAVADAAWRPPDPTVFRPRSRPHRPAHWSCSRPDRSQASCPARPRQSRTAPNALRRAARRWLAAAGASGPWSWPSWARQPARSRNQNRRGDGKRRHDVANHGGQSFA